MSNYRIKVDKEEKIHIIDQGLGMTADELKIHQPSGFSGAEDF
jgi:HSP90 family molecular chaperone